MAKGDNLTQKDLFIWTMHQTNGTSTYYLLEKAPFQTEGLKKCPHRIGSTGDAVFKHLEQAEAELARYPLGADAEAPEAVTADTAAE